MSKLMESLNQELIDFIHQQKVFFVATAAETGSINLSPKGMDSLRVIKENKIVWLNLTGSGNETAAHLLINNRMTIMFCAFQDKPLILRLYGQAKTYHPRDDAFNNYYKLFKSNIGARQIVEMDVNRVQTSCGFAVPLMDFVEERTILTGWANKLGEAKIKDYWKNKNTVSIDGFPTDTVL